MKNPNIRKVYCDCVDSYNLHAELTAFINIKNLVGIVVQYHNDDESDMRCINLDADTAEELANDLLKFAKELRNG